jgi:hypothetical protein
MASVDETPGSPLSINHLMLTLQRGGKAANDAFARENKNEDDQKVLEDAIMIMVALRKQAPFKGTRKTKRDLQGVLKAINRLEMPQGVLQRACNWTRNGTTCRSCGLRSRSCFMIRTSTRSWIRISFKGMYCLRTRCQTLGFSRM